MLGLSPSPSAEPLSSAVPDRVLERGMNILWALSSLFLYLNAPAAFADAPAAALCLDLLQRMAIDPLPIHRAQQLKFSGVGTRDVYNPTAPFTILIHGQKWTVLAARVEPRDKESSKVIFFRKVGDHWSPISGGPQLDLQDPFVTRIGNEVIFGGVQTFEKSEGGLGYKTVFFRVRDLMGLRGRNPRPFAEGPSGMKDIRLLSLPDGRILVATRPQGNENGPGRIGFMILNRLEELTPERILRATVLPHLFAPGEWGGVNEMHLLQDGRIGVLGHIASFDGQTSDGQRIRHYYPIVFAYDPRTGVCTPPKMLLQRSDLDRFGVSRDSKRSDLSDVLFSGGLIRRADGTAVLYVGAGDANTVRIELARDPFLEYEGS